MDLIQTLVKIKSLLADYQLSQDIVEIENISQNKKIIDFLESIGEQEITFECRPSNKVGQIKESGGTTNLWKKNNGKWEIMVWEINRFLNKTSS